MKSKRRLSNVNLTQKYHYRHHGIWVAVTLFLILFANLLWTFMVLVTPTTTFTLKLGITLGLEVIVSFIFVIGLAKFTSHRIAGPFIGLEKVCDRVRNGELDARMHFRSYDRLEELELAFNSMLDELTGAAQEESAGDSEPSPPLQATP